MSDKPREFWHYQLARDHITEHFPQVEEWKQSFIKDGIFHHPEIIHSIEYSAYDAALERIAKLEKALKQMLSRGQRWKV